MALRFVLLALISRQSDTGYGLGRLLRTKLRHLWTAAALQQIYSALARLEADGLVRSELIEPRERRSKRTYSITPKGREALRQWLAQPQKPALCRDDLLIKLFLLPAAPREVVAGRLDERRLQLEAEIRQLRDRLREAEHQDEPADLGYSVALEAAVSAAEAQLSWCFRALARIGVGENEAPEKRLS